MEISAAENSVFDAVATAEEAKQMRSQHPGVAVILRTLQEMQEMQATMMQSLGLGQNFDVVA